MPAPIATLALVTLGGGLALGGWSYKRAKDAQKKDPKPALTEAVANGKIANDQDERAPAADAKTVPQQKAAKSVARKTKEKAA
ncbi:hypothetical protein [Altererythrobacter lutimaris]|uniref:Uncharacterized protein n=1 Tax=Altererythrobacter lutimaris TaxID=2743979 RepID=A0A850HAB6_9SPHN|nr:hypothetical protein [Altererythrobacter lutimaris]NVE94913.1 hypothetical protein [Altererythrobacter lutimaris]